MVAVVGPGACLGRFPGPFQMGYQEACWQRGWLSRGHRVFAHLSSFSYLPHHCKCTPGHHLLGVYCCRSCGSCQQAKRVAAALYSEFLGRGVHCPLDEKEIVCFVQAGVIRALFPEVMETLRFASTPITLKVLNIFRNVMRNLGKRQASPIALQLAEKILPLFNHVSLLWEAESRGWVLDRMAITFLCFSSLLRMRWVTF